MSANETPANDELSRTLDINGSGSCVNCSHPVSFDNFVQCNQCDSWWHMICAGVTESVAERAWTCRNCIPVSVTSKSSGISARVALRLQKLEEERAILEAEKRALELDRKLMEKKYNLLEELLEEERENASNRSRVSRRTSLHRVRHWVNDNPSDGAVGGVPVGETSAGEAPTVGAPAGEVPTVGAPTGGPPVVVTSTTTRQDTHASTLVQNSTLQRQEINMPADRLHFQGTQQRNTGAIPRTGPNVGGQVVEGQVRNLEGNPTPSTPLVMPLGKPPLSSTLNNDVAHPSKNYYQEMLDKFGPISPLDPEGYAKFFGTKPVTQGYHVPTVPLPTLLGRNQTQLAPRVGDNPNVGDLHPSVTPTIPASRMPYYMPMTSVPPTIPATSVPYYVPTTSVPPTVPATGVPYFRPMTNVPPTIPATSVPLTIPVTSEPPTSLVPNLHCVPSPSQLAARQIMPRDLPPFAGDPADWPIFISAFVNTTIACGYSSVENLTRLQRCLKGAAYESVRSRLLLPESVPQIINTLQLLYGCPELLINVLLDKVRSTPAPKAERLETLIEFGMAVQSLCDHLEAAGQQSHLTNPSLLMELVEKLPAHVKMEWANVMQRYPEVNLKTFGDFMNGVVISASKVTQYTGGFSKGGHADRSRMKSKGSINAHVSDPELPKEEDKLCCVCKERGHRVRDCESFKGLSIDNRWKTVQTNELCRSCLNAHGRRSCRNANQCGINGCTFRHHPLLHSNRSNQPSGEPVTPNIESAGNHAHRMLDQSLLFRIIPVTLHGPKKTVKTFAFLDDGSSLTLVEEELANDIGVSGKSAPLCLTWTGNVSRIEADSKQLQLVVSSVNDGKHHKLVDVRTVKKLALPGQTLRINDFVDKFKHLKGLPVSSYVNAVPQLLIGVNNLRLTIPLKVKEGDINEPVAMKTRLGWCVYGGSGAPLSHTLNFHACDCDQDRELHELVKDYFTLEDVGTKPVTELMSAEDRRAQQIMEKTTVRVGDRFETGLLWRYDEIEFPESYGMALRRLECLERRMERNPLLKENIHRQIEEYQQKGYAHRASQEELKAVDPKRVWYLPLGAVVNPKKPEKVRLIWDAAATVNGISLNSLLLKGPDQLTSLPAVLSRFRQYAVAVSADIKEMFHQMWMRGTDRYSLCFLFRKDPTALPDVYVMDVATFGATCSPASAQYVKNRNAAEFTSECPRAVEGIISNHYVDDYLDSFGTEGEAAEIAEQVKNIHSKGGFLLRNWQSNSVHVKQRLGEVTDTVTRHLFLDKSMEYGRVLGMLWLTDEDALSFCAQLKDDVRKIVDSDSRPTKRQVLRCLMSFFDPLGLLSSLLVHGKILLQDIWRAGTQWDQEISDEHWERWRSWTVLLQQISTIKIPRCYFPNATTQSYRQLQLHVFVDASEVAYAAVAYFRIVDADGTPRCALVTAKTKVAPLKPLSIPRMELQAATLGTRLLRFVLESHTVKVTERYLWSDSSTVLAWLKADPRRYKQYVACRIGEILEQTDVNEWRWVPSKQNLADYATKWGSGPSMAVEGVWYQGPSFLQQPEEAWPIQKMPQQVVEEELRACNVHVETTVLSSVIECNRFSKWERLHRAMAYVHRYVGNLKRRIYGEAKNTGYITQEELRQAESTLIRMVQWQNYPGEMAALSSQNHPRTQPEGLNKHSALYQLTPFIDDAGILRVDGRTGAAENVSYEAKFPVILPKNHRVTDLIVDAYHRKFQHANSETVVNELRQRYHVSRLRTVVRRIVNSCIVCKIQKAVPQVPRMASLPPARLASFARPFTYVGLDLFGPLLVKVGRSSAKRWIALFTCLTVRAVHCEVVHSLSTDSCIKSIRRFVCRRGAPAEIYSDNGTNFHGVERVLMRQLQQGLAATVTNTNTKWLFIPPSSPHMGGSWERMVRSVKQAMMGAYNSERKLDDESLNTFVVEAESIVNSRPLTYLPLDAEESEALTPNHFLLGSSSGVRQPVAEPTDSSAAVKNSWNLINHQLDCFWRRWIREMLPTLTRRTKWFGEEKAMAIGDLVLIVEDGKRNSWIRGRVLEVVPGGDGRIRQAIVRTARGLLRRPVAKLAILDIVDSSKTGTGGQCYGGEDVAAGGTASSPRSVVSTGPNRGTEPPSNLSAVNE